MNTPNPHIVKAFDRELAALSTSIEAMARYACTQFNEAVQALLTRDPVRAQRVIDQDREIDGLRRDVSSAAAMLITKRQPVATDLNEVLADFRISEDLERIGDLAKNTAKRTLAIANSSFPDDVIGQLKEFAEAATGQLKAAIDAYVGRDADAARAARNHDDEVDRLHAQVFRDLVARTRGDQSQVVSFVHLLFCAKNIERAGDHAAHIAGAAYLLATGRPPEDDRPPQDIGSDITGETTIAAPPAESPAA